MSDAPTALFDLAEWSSALDKFGAVTRLSVALYDADGALLTGLSPASTLDALFREFRYDPGLFAECARQCLKQSVDHRPPIVLLPPSGVAVVGAALVFEGAVVGAAVAGYAVVDFCDSLSIARLARAGGVPFLRMWEVSRMQQPVPARRLVLHGELLQVLGDTMLNETHRARQHLNTSTALAKALAAKDDLMAVLSHELRSPLTPILGWAQVLKGEASAGQIRRAATVIERNVLLQLRLVEDLLELNRGAHGTTALRMFACDLQEEMRSAVDAVADEAAAKQVAVRLVGSEEPLHILADRDRLQQVFRNVLLNGVKFTESGGRIDVRIVREDGLAVARIRDSGQGIAPEFLPFVFDMFRQHEQGPRRTHGGLGIGLALVKGLVEAHGGSVRVASEGVGHGTEVTLCFPIDLNNAALVPLHAGEAGTATDRC